MSALGQKRTLRNVRSMSALAPKADIGTGPVTPAVSPRWPRSAEQLGRVACRTSSKTLSSFGGHLTHNGHFERLVTKRGGRAFAGAGVSSSPAPPRLARPLLHPHASEKHFYLVTLSPALVPRQSILSRRVKGGRKDCRAKSRGVSDFEDVHVFQIAPKELISDKIALKGNRGQFIFFAGG